MCNYILKMKIPWNYYHRNIYRNIYRYINLCSWGYGHSYLVSESLIPFEVRAALFVLTVDREGTSSALRCYFKQRLKILWSYWSFWTDLCSAEKKKALKGREGSLRTRNSLTAALWPTSGHNLTPVNCLVPQFLSPSQLVGVNPTREKLWPLTWGKENGVGVGS